MKECRYCGTKNNDEDVFCAGCGKPLDKTESKRTSRVIIAVIIAAVLVASCVIAGSKLLTKKQTEATTETSAETSGETSVEPASEKSNEDTIIVSDKNVSDETTTQNQSNIVDSVSEEEYLSYELFLSNFAETGITSFNKDSYDESIIITFSVIHRYINNSGGIKFGEEVTLPASAVQKDSERFFGISLPDNKLKSVDVAAYDEDNKSFSLYTDRITNSKITIENNRFYVIAVPTAIEKVGNREFSVEFDVYHSYNPISSDDYKYKYGDGNLQTAFYKIGKGNSVLSANETGYILNEYSVTF